VDKTSAKLYIDIQIEIQKIETMKNQIKSCENFGDAYGFMDQYVDGVQEFERTLGFYFLYFRKLKGRMESRIQEYKKDMSYYRRIEEDKHEYRKGTKAQGKQRF